MKVTYVLIVIVVAAGLRVAIRQRRRARRPAESESVEPDASATNGHAESVLARFAVGANLGSVGLVARREILERVRGRIFRVGTIFILLAISAAIIIPKIHSNQTTPSQQVGVVGGSAAALAQVVKYSAKESQTTAHVVVVPTIEDAKAELRSGKLDLAIVGGDKIVVNESLSSRSSSDTAMLVQVLAPELGVLHAYQQAGLSVGQIEQVAQARAVPVESLQPGTKRGATKGTSVIGVVLIFLMLTQYNTWILIGVMQEKASRVVEVLLAAVRPVQLLAGKVLGIGLVAMAQATLIVGVAFIVSKAVGSDLLHGTGPVLLLSDLVWLVLGYAFYSWLYAAAGSMAERQDQVQTLALPLSIPILIAYIYSITVASSGNPNFLFKVLAYFPPTAPFAMPVLVGQGQVAWWQFLISVVISLAGTAVMAWFAAGVYRRAVLRSGQRVGWREVTGRSRRTTPRPAPMIDPV